MAVLRPALWNSRITGAIEPRHHVIRICLCAILVLGFSLS